MRRSGVVRSKTESEPLPRAGSQALGFGHCPSAAA
jgi:hypothetical protein